MTERQTILVLQGGGALAAYQAGVVQALQEAGIAPTVVAATSTGALNAAVLCGHRKNDPAAALAGFWQDLGRPSLPFAPTLATALGAYGNPAMYVPRSTWFGLGNWDSLYDTAPLARTLDRHVDFRRLQPRLVLTATDLETGRVGVFDSAAQTIDATHVLAASALPPTFPAVAATTANGEVHRFWDGSLAFVSPLAAVLELVPTKVVDLAVIVDLFPRRGSVPTGMADVGGRMLELLSADRSAEAAERLRRVVWVRPSEPEDPSGVADFTTSAVERRRAAGYADTHVALEKRSTG